MGMAWKRHLDRIAAQGLVKSIGYYVATVGLERIGVHFIHSFRFTHTSTLSGADSELTFAALESMNEWTERDLDVLNAYGGDSLLASFREGFSRGETCFVARVADHGVACVSWIAKCDRYFLSERTPCWLIQRCFTIPSHRGMGLYPRTLMHACNYIRDAKDASGLIFIECSTFNYSSIHGIRKAGFVPAGKVVEVFGKKLFRRAIPAE